MYITQKTFADLVDQVVTITDAQNAEIAAIKDKLNGGNGHAAMDEHLLVAHVRNLQHQINKMDDRLARQDETSYRMVGPRHSIGRRSPVRR
jgi:hypothetical protein